MTPMDERQSVALSPVIKERTRVRSARVAGATSLSNIAEANFTRKE